MKLKQLPGKNMYLVGGATLAQTFTKLGLIDEYNIIVHPVILGNGKPLLRDVNVRRNLKLIEYEDLLFRRCGPELSIISESVVANQSLQSCHFNEFANQGCFHDSEDY